MFGGAGVRCLVCSVNFSVSQLSHSQGNACTVRGRGLPFIADTDVRLGIEDRIRAAWIDFNAREWMGATVFAGAALEALLLWALKRAPISKIPKKPLEELHLADLIRYAADNVVISEDSERQASLAKDARNLIHPGKALRSGEACNKTTALTAITAIYRVIDELKRSG
jgi:hypothetical protein